MRLDFIGDVRVWIKVEVLVLMWRYFLGLCWGLFFIVDFIRGCVDS